jgi:SAM-dependent methyltransferase
MVRLAETGSPVNTSHPASIVEDGLRHGIRLQCPQCGAAIEASRCCICGFLLHVCDGILDALPPARKAYYARFIEDYERIRAAEGRGSASENFYLALPYEDLSGRNCRQWRIRAQSFNCLMQQVLKPNFPKSGARILDLGAGNTWMSYRLATAGHHPVAVDLLVNAADGLAAAEHYRAHLPRLFPRIRAELARLPLEQDQFDAAIFNASFHYAENYAACLREAFRCVRTGGLVIISDTPWYSSDRSGQEMLAERRSHFLAQYGVASDSIASLEYLTDERLRMLERQFSIRWTAYTPRYDLGWRMRPHIARLRHRREPSRFRIYAARKPAT